jgi:uncharacterized membrane protein YhaH (DUF805 family)
MDFKTSVNSVLNNFINFEGRASRSEYWWFFLFYVIVYVGAMIIDSMLSMGVLVLLVSLGLLAPSLSVGTRRLHDTGKSGWWQLLYLIPLVGMVVMIYFLVQKGDTLPNRFGPPVTI